VCRIVYVVGGGGMKEVPGKEKFACTRAGKKNSFETHILSTVYPLQAVGVGFRNFQSLTKFHVLEGAFSHIICKPSHS
jgi:hypothetical protein